ncbi:hypothetical protein [Pseudactinotalea sp. Z1748]|uniref:hypothetical protein n=1 Tax=Pseudactinotalea sp. Z1748 TaxID=3413027 RepID=UPI003C7BDE77
MSEDAVRAPHLFTLTKITGRRRTDDRTIIVSSFEFNRRQFNVFLTGLGPTVLIAGIAATIIGIYALLVAVVVMVGWFILVERRSKSGLRTRTWQTLLDKRRTLAGKFIQSGVVITDDFFDHYQVVHSAVPLSRVSLAQEATEVLAGSDGPALVGQPAAPQPAQVPARRRRSKRNPEPDVAATSPGYDLDDILPGGSS